MDPMHVVIVGISLEYSAHRDILRGVRLGVAERPGWTLRIFPSGQTLWSIARAHLARQKGDVGVVTLADEAGGLALRTLARRGFVVTHLLSDEQPEPILTANVDDQAIGRMAAEHLLERRFRSFGYLGGPGTEAWARRRGEGFVARLAEAGHRARVFEHRPSWVQGLDRSDVLRYTAADERRLIAWLRGFPRPAALFVCNDIRARGVVDACQAAGIEIPGQVAILGVDDDANHATISAPHLSSVSVPWVELGRSAIELMDQPRPRTLRRIVLPPTRVVTRFSTDMLAVAEPELAEALRYMREHCDRPLSLMELVRHVPMSRRTLQRRVKAVLGHTIPQELNRMRVERARQLLETSDLSLKAVARGSGFRDLPRLVKVFKSLTGVTPGRYRRQAARQAGAVL